MSSTTITTINDWTVRATHMVDNDGRAFSVNRGGVAVLEIVTWVNDVYTLLVTVEVSSARYKADAVKYVRQYIRENNIRSLLKDCNNISDVLALGIN